MKLLWLPGLLLTATLALSAPAPDDTLLYFSPGPLKPELVRVKRDLVQWRLDDQYFEMGPDLPGTAGPVLIGTAAQIQRLGQAHEISVETFGPVRGFESLFPEMCAPQPDPAAAVINITNGYHDEEAVAALLLQFETNFPSLAQRQQIGSTHKGRPIWTLKISDNVATEEPEPRVVIDAGIHAREFAGPEVALDIIWQLLYGYTNNAAFASWVNGMEIYVIPCLNPDGRYFCDTVSTSWRKNGRNNDTNAAMSISYDGVDLNRNSSFHWGSDNIGSSTNIGDSDYRGPSPASEPEIQAYDALLQRVRPGYTFSLHSYWGLFYGPYGDTNIFMPAPDPFRALGDAMAAVCTNDDNSAYTFVSGPEFATMPDGYTANGDRVDANHGLYGIQSYGVELGVYGHQQTDYTVTRTQLVPGVRLGWQKLLAAAHTNWPKARGWALDAATGQPAPVRIHSLNLTNRPNDEHWTSRGDGFFECPLPTAGTYRLVFTPLGQPSRCVTQTWAIGSTALSTGLVFGVAPILGAPDSGTGLQAWSNQHENGTIVMESTDLPEGPWLPLAAQACTGRTGQLLLPATTTTRYLRVHSAPRILPSGTNLAWVPAGRFRMGADGTADTNEQPAAAVQLAGFAADATEVTYTNWAMVRRWALSNGYYFATGQCGVVAGGGAAASSNHPVVKVGWHDAVKFCNARSQYEGLMPAYYTTAGQTNLYKSNTVDLTAACVNWNANGYRLPTEAEWEKAARGGFTGREYPWGDAIAASNANFNAAGTSNAAAYAANGYGLRDAAGNVAEWCWDWFGSYSNRMETHPTGPTSGTFRVVRGGSWSNAAAGLRCAGRTAMAPASSNTVTGFRCVRAAVYP